MLKELPAMRKPATLSKETRYRVVRRLLKERPVISVSDYLAALDGSVTRQQAHRDLVSFPRIVAMSDRRGRKYRLGRHHSPSQN